jgi:hypothetical protein
MQSETIQLRFPAGGVVRRMGYQNQSPFTSPAALNFWPDDATLERERGGVRPGNEKAFVTDCGGAINLIADVAYSVSGVYKVKTVVACGGLLYWNDGSDTTLHLVSTAITLASDIPLGHADLYQQLYILGDNSADRNLCVFDPVANTLVLVVATAGTIPTKGRLLCNYNNRLVIVRDDDPQNFFACRLGDPTDWDYAVDEATAAFEANASDQGRIGEPIRALIPHNGCLLLGCTTSLWIMFGDISANGELKNLAENIGIVDTNAWCYDTKGYLYILSQDGVYCMPPGCGQNPTSVSKSRLPQELLNLDRAVYRVSMAYDVRYRGVLLSVTTIASNAMNGWWIDPNGAQSGDAGGAAVSFWPITFTDSGQHPFILYSVRDGVFTSDGPSSMLMGGRDGYVRRFNRTATADDGTLIAAFVDYGPFPLGPSGKQGLLQDVQVTLGAGSGLAECQARAGKSSEQAYERAPMAYKKLGRPGLNVKFQPRLSGQSALIRIVNVNGSRCSIEDICVSRIEAGDRRV